MRNVNGLVGAVENALERKRDSRKRPVHFQQASETRMASFDSSIETWTFQWFNQPKRTFSSRCRSSAIPSKSARKGDEGPLASNLSPVSSKLFPEDSMRAGF